MDVYFDLCWEGGWKISISVKCCDVRSICLEGYRGGLGYELMPTYWVALMYGYSSIGKFFSYS